MALSFIERLVFAKSVLMAIPFIQCKWCASLVVYMIRWSILFGISNGRFCSIAKNAFAFMGEPIPTEI